MPELPGVGWRAGNHPAGLARRPWWWLVVPVHSRGQRSAAPGARREVVTIEQVHGGVCGQDSQWIEARITNLKIAAEEADLEPNPEARNWLPRRKLMKVPEPAVTDQATIAAHLAAFGSDNVRTLHQSWRSAIVKIRLELAVLQAIADNYQEGQEHPLHYLKDLRKELHPNELRARQALADAIAKELGHR